MSKLAKDMTPEEREARRQTVRRYYAANRERILASNREYARQYHAANREQRSEYGRQYRADNSKRLAERQRLCRAAARDRVNARNREYMRQYRAANRGRSSLYQRQRRAADPAYKLSLALRTRLRMAVSRDQRSGSAVRDLGMPIAEFKARLESQFLPGMTWENWGRGPGSWQIDHVYPLAAADLTDRAQLLAVCNYRNLQPLWFADNLAKGDSVSPEAQALFDELVSLFQGGAR
jgi:hypothetical protein